MQARMKQNQLSPEAIEALMNKQEVGHLATQNIDGFPYVVPVHFVFTGSEIYIHGLNCGQKLANIQANAKVCFEVEEMDRLIMDEKACDVNTKYQSVIAFGHAAMIEKTPEKISALDKVVAKYTPQLAGQEYPENMLKATGIIKITIESITGKYFG
ncbi:pyridoxamine 5'-phosphate oxidase family protein [Mangrovibacterium lignilyticum]|uniref:pyridoxamine 5'-phosphate oxidase family protein n=1 Tax=Mangrovibacterium lignilyticum TaxID=2668052 RepID=UPI0013D1C8AF|nr:pyridoxamine 5'-phosphate oxidase family protein [Mangrovibacterium lignilyticum]